MAPIVSLADYQMAVGTSENAGAQQLALDDAIQAALNYTDRDFGTTLVTETRTFPYRGKGILEIDDAAEVTSVTGSMVVGSWIAMKEGPAAVPVFSYLILPASRLPSGEMGFTQNMDPLGLHFRTQQLPIIEVAVTGTWGWPTIPNDVRRAIIFLAQEYERAAESGGSGDLQSKSVAEVAESYFEGQSLVQPRPIEGIPDRAADILWPYKRHSL